VGGGASVGCSTAAAVAASVGCSAAAAVGCAAVVALGASVGAAGAFGAGAAVGGAAAGEPPQAASSIANTMILEINAIVRFSMIVLLGT
jgi:hypothetical protein